MKWFLGITVALVGLLSAGAAAAAAAGPVTARDTASTKAFIGGALGVDRAMLAHGPAELAAGSAYAASVGGDCGSVRLQLPRKTGAERVLVLLQFAIEVGAAYDDVTLTSVRPAIDRIAHADEQLRFSDPALEWTVHGSTPALAALLALRPTRYLRGRTTAAGNEVPADNTRRPAILEGRADADRRPIGTRRADPPDALLCTRGGGDRPAAAEDTQPPRGAAPRGPGRIEAAA
jgi:hypothetical protein